MTAVVSNVESSDTRISNARRTGQLAGEYPDEVVLRHIALDGGEPGFTWSWLDRRSGQLAGALAERGLGLGDRLALGPRNSEWFVPSVLAAWNLGAVPVPRR